MKIFIVCGEVSGDKIAATICPYFIETRAHVNAWGGKHLQQAGAEILKYTTGESVMGFWEVFWNIGAYFSMISSCKKDILRSNTELLVLVDFSEFNMRLLSWAKKQGLKVVYLVPPKVWASRESRIHRLKKYCDQIIVVYPFEQEYFHKRGVEVQYFGHPLFEHSKNISHQKNDIKRALIIPGSRRQEVKYILPELVKMIKVYPDYHWMISRVASVPAEIYTKITARIPKERFEFFSHPISELNNSFHFALVASGTASMEIALLGIPQIVCYRTHALNYFIAKRLIKTKFISLVNLMNNQELVKELIQDELNPENIKSAIEEIVGKKIDRIQINAFCAMRNDLIIRDSAKKIAEYLLSI